VGAAVEMVHASGVNPASWQDIDDVVLVQTEGTGMHHVLDTLGNSTSRDGAC
jgi:hypothetical protein